MPSTANKPPLSNAAGEFGRRVRAHRHELELSQEELAERSGLHWSYVGQVERGQNNLSLHNILRLAQVLEIDPGDLVTGLIPPPFDVPTAGSVAQARRVKRQLLQQARAEGGEGS